MSKQYVRLVLEDMYAIEHALQLKVENKKIMLAFAKVAADLSKNIMRNLKDFYNGNMGISQSQ